MKILIVEDRPEVSTLLARLFEPVADEIHVAGNYADAMKTLRDVPALDLVTIDLGLPDSLPANTMASLHRFRENNPDSVLVVITGMATKEDAQRCLAAGANGFLQKLEVPNRLTLFERIAQIARSMVETPQRYVRNIQVAETLAKTFSDYVREAGGSPPRNLRCCLQ